MLTAHRVFIGKIESGYEETIRRAFSWLNAESLLAGKNVFVKANFTYPEFRPGVMTTPEAVAATLCCLRDLRCRVCLGEADSGGYNPFSMDEVFKKLDLARLAEKYDAKLVNLSRQPQKTHTFTARGRTYNFQYAALFDETDMTISMPVPKIHMNTGVSFAFKNLWGCISFPCERLRLHPIFRETLVEISGVCKLGMAVMDGRYGLNRSGPLAGDVVDLGWLMASFSPGAVCNTAARLMRLDPFKDSAHLGYLRDRGLVPDIGGIEFNQDWRDFVSPEQFHLKRAWTDYPGLIAFNSRFWTHIAYFSKLSKFLHWVLYLFRERFY